MQVRIMFFVMFCIFKDILCIWSVWDLDKWWTRRIETKDDGLDYFEKVTGRVFVTLLGFPPNCERKGASHSCTLSLACWWVGGSSLSGCGASPWLVACCVKHNHHQEYSEIHTRLDFKEYEAGHLSLETRENVQPQSLQRRNDVLDNYDDICGISNDRILQKRIVGGQEADFGQFPWQAYIKISTYQCGGVIVSRKFVATAAHCILTARLTDILVYLGELDTQDTGKVEELAPAELHRVKRRIIHPKFRYKATQPDRYDIALLEMITEAGYNFHISPICLPDESVHLVGRTAVVAGWGKVNPLNMLMGTNVLRSVSVPILDIKECMAWHKVKQIVLELHSEMMCAGHKNGQHDACLGDSGGPLILLENGRWTLVGITSAGFGCGEAHQPGIYHRVPMSVKWIKSVINNE